MKTNGPDIQGQVTIMKLSVKVVEMIQSYGQEIWKISQFKCWNLQSFDNQCYEFAFLVVLHRFNSNTSQCIPFEENIHCPVPCTK